MMKAMAVAALAALAIFGAANAQTITTEQDQNAGDAAEFAALAKEANGSVYNLPHDKKMRLVTIFMKHFIQESFIDPDTVKAVITNDPHHVDFNVWEGILNGGHHTYSGMAVCARINGKNRMGGYTGDVDYLVIFTGTGAYRYFFSPFYSEITHTMERNEDVARGCAA